MEALISIIRERESEISQARLWRTVAHVVTGAAVVEPDGHLLAQVVEIEEELLEVAVSELLKTEQLMAVEQAGYGEADADGGDEEAWQAEHGGARGDAGGAVGASKEDDGGGERIR